MPLITEEDHKRAETVMEYLTLKTIHTGMVLILNRMEDVNPHFLKLCKSEERLKEVLIDMEEEYGFEKTK